MIQKEKMIKDKIIKWIKDYAIKHNKTTLVVGVSGGIDSAVTSALCAETGLKTIPVVMSIKSRDILALDQIWWLDDNYSNISRRIINLEKIFHEFVNASKYLGADSELGFANSRSRLRMVMLYQIAQSNNGLVIGTGNKVEDFGVGFYTKYGDGGVDISPIADLYKSEVYALGTHLKILGHIMRAPPTDGLWEDGRTDEDQLGLTYAQLEDAMRLDEMNAIVTNPKKQKILKRFQELKAANLHKMVPIPVWRKDDI
jgi:NAD+ synthase